MKKYGIENFEERLANAREAREKMHAEKFAAAAKVIGDEGARALSELYEQYGDEMYLLYARLWDTEIGGFYYSTSAMETEGYLPDIESTVQALRSLSNCGIFPAYYDVATPEWMREKLIRFAQSLFDPEDGYVYHPQWGYNISPNRRGRDLSWANGMLKNFGANAPCPTAYERLENAAKSDSKEAEANNTAMLPEHLRSVEAFREYLQGFTNPDEKYCISKYSYGLFNLLSAQQSQIFSAGDEFKEALFEFIEAHQREDNGLYQDVITYGTVNGLMKATLIYSGANRPFPNAVAALKSAIEVANTKEIPHHVCCFYNPIITINNLLNNIAKFGDKSVVDETRAELVRLCPSLIRGTRDKVALFKKADGGFSFYKDHTSTASQGAPAAADNFAEGDINATSIASTGVVTNLSAVLGIKVIPMFCREDGELFLDIIKNREPIKKTVPMPENIRIRSKDRQ